MCACIAVKPKLSQVQFATKFSLWRKSNFHLPSAQVLIKCAFGGLIIKYQQPHWPSTACDIWIVSFGFCLSSLGWKSPFLITNQTQTMAINQPSARLPVTLLPSKFHIVCTESGVIPRRPRNCWWLLRSFQQMPHNHQEASSAQRSFRWCLLMGELLGLCRVRARSWPALYEKCPETTLVVIWCYTNNIKLNWTKVFPMFPE